MKRQTTSSLTFSEKFIRLNELCAEAKNQSDRACALIFSANLDNRLRDIIEMYSAEMSKERLQSVFGANGAAGSFSAKINFCYMIGMLAENELHDLDLIRRIRNVFAHEEHGWDFEHPDISKQCRSFRLVHEMKTDYPDFMKSVAEPRDAFVVCAASLTLLLIARADEAKKVKSNRKVREPGRIFSQPII